MNKIIWTPKALKQLLRIDVRYIPRVQSAVNSLDVFPNVTADIKKLKGTENRYRLRVGNYRVLFDVINGETQIISIAAIKRRDEQTYQ